LRALNSVDRDQRRKQALDAYLLARSADGFHVESRTDTHAIIARPGFLAGLLDRVRLNGRKRQVISVDEHGTCNRAARRTDSLVGTVRSVRPRKTHARSGFGMRAVAQTGAYRA